MNELRVSEIFHSILGESSLMGLPCIFVRLQGCGLRCVWCDTEYALDFHKGGVLMTLEEILAKLRTHNCKLVQITGGEPLEQEGVYLLMTRLCDEGFHVLLETGGYLDISRVDPRVKRIVDLKCPSCKMTEKNYWKNIEYLTSNDEVKFVIGTREDYEWSKQIMRTYSIDQICPVLLSVVFRELEPLHLAEWMLSDGLNVRLQLQMHKYIWSSEMRGV